MSTPLDILGHEWHRRAPGTLEGALGDSWYQGRTIFGGLVAAVLARAASDAVGDARRVPRSLTVQYAAPVEHGEAIAVAQVVRAGKYVTQLSARLEQGGKPVALALGSFGIPRQHVLAVRAAPPPAVRPFAQVASMPKIDGAPTFTQHIDLRFAIGSVPFSGAAHPEVGGWCRLRRSGVPDLETMCVLLDAWPLPALSMLTRPTPGATIDSTYHFLSNAALPPRQPGEDEPAYLFHCVSPTIESGYAEHMGQLWTAEGLLVGRVRQMAAIF